MDHLFFFWQKAYIGKRIEPKLHSRISLTVVATRMITKLTRIQVEFLKEYSKKEFQKKVLKDFKWNPWRNNWKKILRNAWRISTEKSLFILMSLFFKVALTCLDSIVTSKLTALLNWQYVFPYHFNFCLPSHELLLYYIKSTILLLNRLSVVCILAFIFIFIGRLFAASI